MAVDELVRSGQAARELGVSVGQVQQWADRNVLPVAARTPDGWRLFRMADVRRLAAQREARRKARAALPPAPAA